ncbi:MAG: Lrp/AsnC family transcriptional regulator, partial [Glutamicibacter arilaitensis]
MQLLDSTDRRILHTLSTTAKRTGSAIATALNLGRNTVQTRMTRLENEVLDSVDRRIPPEALGYGLLSFVELHVEQRCLEEIAAKL